MGMKGLKVFYRQTQHFLVSPLLHQRVTIPVHLLAFPKLLANQIHWFPSLSSSIVRHVSIEFQFQLELHTPPHLSDQNLSLMRWMCMAMIECLDDVFRAPMRLVHRNIKPDNFLVRVDRNSKKCTVVLGDLGMVKILDSISSSTSSKSAIQGERKEKTKQKNSGCGTLVYNSYETLLDGTQTQKSDGYSLGMSILALFLCEPPFTSLPIFRERLMENDVCPRLSQSPLFKSLLTIEGGKYELVHKCLNEVFTELTQLDVDKRMSVHEARKKVLSIKHLLPKIGEGFKCPSIDDIVKDQLAKYGNPGCIVEEGEDVARIKKSDYGYDGKKEYGKRIEFDEPISVSLPSALQNMDKENHDIPSHDQESQSSHQDVKQIHTSQDSISTIQSTVHDHRDMITFSYERDGSGQKIFSAEENDHISKHQCLHPSSDSFFPILKDEKELEWQKYQKELNLSGVVMDRLCRLGKGGFGEVFLVEVNDIPFPCVLKRMLRKNREFLVNIEMRCRMEFEMQKKLFEDSVCFYRIPRPLYILGPLDDDWRKCDSGFIMEFCDGGSVKNFSRIWCSDGKYANDQNDSDTYNRYSDIDTSILNPVKIASVCVGMIECLDDVFRAKNSFVHRDVKPDNFLVRISSKDEEFIVVLSDLGIAQIFDSVSSTTSTTAMCDKKKEKNPNQRPSRCGTLGMSILALFLDQDPFIQMPIFRRVRSHSERIEVLKDCLREHIGPTIEDNPLFDLLLDIEGGKYYPVHACLSEVFMGLTRLDEDDRMSVHMARKKVQSIKYLLPKIGECLKRPSLDDIIFYYNQSFAVKKKEKKKEKELGEELVDGRPNE
ncbi:hypothetical protein ADUPG1_009214 [Aduncisulcus paluster]|uniref:Protein kinase domain-containing protein n=1 Tax=Aduncisulcus paluster TaxID=2918883 RepID=A0ABQ5KYR0_9EUKA|nr:hypothetical protein ADUPG1_009214 [Aduncisulcus paluster]